jgi:hypothetical protein
MTTMQRPPSAKGGEGRHPLTGADKRSVILTGERRCKGKVVWFVEFRLKKRGNEESQAT